MTLVRVKGFKVFSDRHGKRRCYHRRSGKPVDLERFPFGSVEFFVECERLCKLVETVEQAKPGTLGLLISKYRAHPAFGDLASRTRKDYQRTFDYLKPIADTPLVKFDTPLVVKIRDKAADTHGRRFGNYVRTVLALLFSWGRERGYLKDNPAARIKSIKRSKSAPEANRPWRDHERHAVLEALPSHMIVPVALMMFCGLDPQDAISLKKSAISDGNLNTSRQKTGEAVWVPLPRVVRDALGIAPTHDAITVCANSRGRPWTVSGFRASWRPIKKRLEAEGAIGSGLTLKGLRHTVATILAEMGHDERTIADMLGQKTTEMARHYSRHANKSKKLAKVVPEFDAELNKRRTKVVKPR